MSTVIGSPAAQLNLQLHVTRLSNSQLIRDYYDAAPALAPFFNGFPWDPTAVRRIASQVGRQFDREARIRMKAALHPTTDAARAKLDRIVEGEGFFITTGQQAGLFSGPLFTIYKTITAIKVAEAYESLLGAPVAALFWAAADDHDFAEINHAFIIGADNDLHRVDIAAPDDVPSSMHRRVLGDDIVATVDALAGWLPPNDTALQVVEWARASYQPGRTVAAAFNDFMHRIFATHDLLITSSADATVKALSAPVIRRELEREAEHGSAIRKQTDRLLAAGYHEQVTVRAGAANVLYEDDEGRERLVKENGQWNLSRSKRRLETDEITQLLVEAPERFSPNVHLRPVVSSAIFPSLAYVGGPAEVSYYAQIGCLFELHDVPMPLVYPRASMEIVEYKVQKVLDKFGLSPQDVRQPFDQLSSQVIRDELPKSITATAESLREGIAAGYAELIAATQNIDPTLKGPLENARNASHKALADAEKKIVSHLKKKNEIGIEQLRKASANLFPNGASQERTLSAVSFLARHGPAFIDAVAAALNVSLDAVAAEWQGVACD